MCLSKKEREFIQDWLDYTEGKMSLVDFVTKWKTEGKDWKVYDRMLNDLIFMKRFLELEYHP
jgi:hypothetical protein